jgi:hypothetical protein
MRTASSIQRSFPIPTRQKVKQEAEGRPSHSASEEKVFAFVPQDFIAAKGAYNFTIDARSDSHSFWARTQLSLRALVTYRIEE